MKKLLFLLALVACEVEYVELKRAPIYDYEITEDHLQISVEGFEGLIVYYSDIECSTDLREFNACYQENTGMYCNGVHEIELDERQFIAISAWHGTTSKDMRFMRQVHSLEELRSYAKK
jgi:hypothetical protein